jgi:hypothetical protein
LGKLSSGWAAGTHRWPAFETRSVLLLSLACRFAGRVVSHWTRI